MINPAPRQASIVMRTAALLTCFLGLALGACLSDVDLGTFNFATYSPAPVVTGACVSDPKVLAQIPNLLPRPFLLAGDAFVVATDGAGDTANETIWDVPLSGAAPIAIATAQSSIQSITVAVASEEDQRNDAWSLFWTAAGTEDGGAGGAIWTVDSSKVPRVVRPNRLSPGAIVGGDMYLLWVEEGVDPDGARYGALMAGAPAGTEATLLQRTAPDQVPNAFDVLPNTYVWTTVDPTLDNARSAQVISAPSAFPFGLQTQLAGPDGGGAGGILASSGGSIFYSTPADISVIAPGGEPQLLVPLAGVVARIKATGNDIYFIQPSTGILLAASQNVSAGGSTRVVANDVDPYADFHVDTACAYWLDARTSSVMMVSK